MDAKPNIKRHWFRFSLRALLLLVTIASVGFGWFAYKLRQAQRQKEAVEAIDKLGWFVKYDYEVDPKGGLLASPTPPGPIWLRELLGVDFFASVAVVQNNGESFTDAQLVHLQGIPGLKSLYMLDTKTTDAGLLHLHGLTQLEDLVLGRAQITDTGLVHLQGLTKLKTLNLDRTQITDAGLSHLQGLTKLQLLCLESTHITDTGLKNLRGLTELESLWLSNTQITDAGLLHLQGLTELKELRLDWTDVTDKGCQKLQNALPNLKIIR
jgi:hypothetical protein